MKRINRSANLTAQRRKTVMRAQENKKLTSGNNLQSEHEFDATKVGQSENLVAKGGIENPSIDKQQNPSTKIQRKDEEEKENSPGDGNELMAKAEDGGLKGTEQLEKQLNSSKGNGSSLDSNVKSEMEHKMGADLGEVKIHTDANADQMAKG